MPKPIMMDAFSPPASLIAKLASIVVHTEEMLSPGGHEFDKLALDGLLSAPDVQEWVEACRKLALVPEKR